MLGKLIKHDFKALSRILLPTQLAIVGVTLFGTLGFIFNMRTSFNGADSNTGIMILKLIAGLLFAFMIFAIMAACVLVAFIIFQRFYKNFMCDEGYLTFTLPVSTTELLLSKLITAMLWFLISVVVIFLCVNVFVLLSTTFGGRTNIDFYRQVGRIISSVVGTFGARLIWPCVEFVLLIIATMAFNILHVYLSLIIGGVVSQKHKLLAGIGFYFAINFVVGMVASIGQYFVGGSFINSINNVPAEALDAVGSFDLVLGAMQPFILFYFGITVVFSVAAFFVSNYFLKNKLNLE